MRKRPTDIPPGTVRPAPPPPPPRKTTVAMTTPGGPGDAAMREAWIGIDHAAGPDIQVIHVHARRCGKSFFSRAAAGLTFAEAVAAYRLGILIDGLTAEAIRAELERDRASTKT